MICGVRVEDIEDETEKHVRQLDELVDDWLKADRMRRSCGHERRLSNLGYSVDYRQTG